MRPSRGASADPRDGLRRAPAVVGRQPLAFGAFFTDTRNAFGAQLPADLAHARGFAERAGL